MGWRLKVSGYGKIEKAEIETAPLTLFVELTATNRVRV